MKNIDSLIYANFNLRTYENADKKGRYTVENLKPKPKH